MGKFIYRKILQIGHDQWKYRNGMVQERGEDGLLQWELMNKNEKRGYKWKWKWKGGVFLERKITFKPTLGDLWDLHGKDMQLWLREAIAVIKCGK